MKYYHSHYFLAQSGVNAQEVGEKLKRLDTRITFQPSEQFNENDIEVPLLKRYYKDKIEIADRYFIFLGIHEGSAKIY